MARKAAAIDPHVLIARRYGVPIDPKLPPRFDDTPNESRPASHDRWYGRPYIVTRAWEQMHTGAKVSAEQLAEWRTKWFEAYPSGIRYDVRCLDGGAWDRSTGWGFFPTLQAALSCALGIRQSPNGQTSRTL